MKRRLAVAAACALLSVAAHSQNRVFPTIDVTALTVKVIWAENQSELAAFAEEFGIPPWSLDGFSQLRRNVETGEYVCDIYALRPKRVSDDMTTTLGHELMHCLAGDYHR